MEAFSGDSYGDTAMVRLKVLCGLSYNFTWRPQNNPAEETVARQKVIFNVAGNIDLLTYVR